MPAKVNVSLGGLGTLAIWIIALFVFVPEFIAALKDVSVTIPQAVRRGGNALFICNYDMENDTLYSVKWYKGRREFYRYTPKENPAMKTFLSAGIDVERNLSNQSHVVLLAVPLNISGKFTCEISVEAPSFLTAMVSGEMEVVELPEQRPIVTGIHSRYRLGDLVDGNCSIKFSKPAANLTWTINGVVVPPHHIKMHQIERYAEHNLESVYSEIGFMVTTQHFIKGQMKLKCTASIFNIYKEEVEKVIEEDRPRIMASGRSFDMNAYPYDQQSSGDFEDHNESYLTYYSAADVSSSATSIQSTRWGLGLTIGRLASTLQRLVVSTSSASLSSITNVSRRLLRGQIENADMPAKICYFIAISVAAAATATTTAQPVIVTASTPAEREEHNAIVIGAYAAMIMFTVAIVAIVAIVVVVIFFVRWRFNDFLSTEKGYYHSPRRHRHHHYSDNEIDTNRGGVLSSPGQRQQQRQRQRQRHEHLHQCHHRHQHQEQQTPQTMEQQRQAKSPAPAATATDSHRLLLLLPMARRLLDAARINHPGHVEFTSFC